MASDVIPEKPYLDKENAIDKSIAGKNAWLKGHLPTTKLRTTVLNAWTDNDRHEYLKRRYNSANARQDEWNRAMAAYQEEQDGNEKPTKPTKPKAAATDSSVPVSAAQQNALKKIQTDAFAEKTKEYKAQLATFNKVQRKKPPQQPIVVHDPGDYVVGADSDAEDDVFWVHVKILEEATGAETFEILSATDFQNRLIPTAHTYTAMTVDRLADPTDSIEANMGDTIVVERFNKSGNLVLYLAGTFCGVVGLDEETDPSKQKFVLLMKTTYTNGKEVAEKIPPHFGFTGPVVPYGPGCVAFSKVYGLLHSKELPTPNALTVYAYALIARDWTFFDYEMAQLTKEAKKAPRSAPAEGFEVPAESKWDQKTGKKSKRSSMGSPDAIGKKSKQDQQPNAATTESHLLSSKFDFLKGTTKGTSVLQTVTMQSITYNHTTIYFKNEAKTPLEKLQRELVFKLKVFGCAGELNIKCDHQMGGFHTALMNAATEYNNKSKTKDEQMPDFSDEDVKSMACSQFSQFSRKLRIQVRDNRNDIKEHPHFEEKHTDIRPPQPTARSVAKSRPKVAKSRPKKGEPKDRNTGEATAAAKKIETLQAELVALKAQKLVEKGASPTNQKTAHVVNMNVNAKLMMTTVGKELFSAANDVTSAADINNLYNLRYIGAMAMDIAQKVSCADWLQLHFPNIPETEYLDVKLYDLSTAIKKCLNKKVVKDVEKTDLKTWFPELVDPDVPAAMPIMWPINAATPKTAAQIPLSQGCTPGWRMPGASPGQYDMGRSQAVGMGASPVFVDRQSIASGRLSLGQLPGADYPGALSAEEAREFQQYQQEKAAFEAQKARQLASQANQQASNASSGAADAPKRKDKDDGPENPPAKKQRTSLVAD